MIDLSELNSIPGNTPLTAEDAERLIPDISTKRELDEFERANILQAQTWAFGPRTMNARNPLDEIYVRELHRRMFNGTWQWAGTYRLREVNRGCQPREIITRMGNLLADVAYWIERNTFSLDEIAVRFHHRLVGPIHAFPNGNGRHARMIADVVVVKQGGTRFTWGGANLSAVGTARNTYLNALYALDENENNVAPLLAFVRS
jgi:Fic-DOC domain mobile mystery protein B